MESKPRRIVIIGLGLIGGSLAAASRKAFPRAKIIGISRSRVALAVAKKRRWIHEGFTDLNRAFSLVGAALRGRPDETDPGIDSIPGRPHRGAPTVVVLCTPVDTLKNYLKRLDQIAPPGTVVTDAGSVKGFLVRWADGRRWKRIHFVGAHPMAGSHERGIQAARPDLFEGALTFVTPGRNRRGGPAWPPAEGRPHRGAPTIKTVVNFWQKISRRVVIVSPEIHDRLTAQISHVPHLMAALLVGNASQRALSFAACGFLDTTRVAEGNPDLWLPIFLENRGEVLRSLKSFERGLKHVKNWLRKGEGPRLRQLLRAAQARRRALEAH